MMSEEEREIDVELDDGFDGESNLDSSGTGLPENKRALHNAMERKRRDSIKDSFRGLQECIPTLRGDKTSRAQVLKKTGDYISHMQKKISSHQDEIKELKNQNTSLEAQIRALEKAKVTGNFVNTSSILESDNLVSGEDLELDGMDGSEIVYDDTSSDNSDSTQGLNGILQGASSGLMKTGNGLMTVTLPTVPGVTMSLPTMQHANSAMSPGASLQSAVQAAVGNTMSSVGGHGNSLAVHGNSLSGGHGNTTPSVTVIQPGQSLLTSNNTIRVQPGQSLLLSEPLRKKMKF